MLTTLIGAVFAQGAEPSLIVEPSVRQQFEPQTVRVENVPFGAMVVLEAEFTTELGGEMKSSAVFFANENGIVDVATDYATDGTYEGVDPHGLIWSAQYTPSEEDPEVERRTDDPILVTYRARVRNSSDTMALIELETTQTLKAMRDGVRYEDINEGDLRGRLYYPEGQDELQTVIMMEGSGGGIYGRPAALYASEGFAVFALGYHSYQDRPDAIMNIPIEYVESAIAYISTRFEDEKSALVGHSRGAELAMLTAVNFPDQVDAVIALGPNSAIERGCCTPESFSSASWTVAGKPLPVANGPLPMDMDEALPDGVPYTYRPFFLSKTTAPDASGAPIEVERMAAPIMLVAGGADRTWPAKEAALLLEKRLIENDYPFAVEVEIYPGAGHSAGTAEPFSDFIEYFQSEDGGSNPLGGTPAANARASYDAIPVQVEFLKTHTGASRR